MIESATQNGDKIYLRDDKGRVIIRRGYLVSHTKTRASYINNRHSKTVLVVDDKGRYIHSFNVSKEITGGIGW